MAKGTRKGKAQDETTLQNKARKNEMDFVLIRIYVLYCWVRLRRNDVLNPSSLGYSAQKIAIMQAFCSIHSLVCIQSQRVNLATSIMRCKQGCKKRNEKKKEKEKRKKKEKS